jgi:antitoxin component YwqK of YwqJK toxin-antitoxin module
MRTTLIMLIISVKIFSQQIDTVIYYPNGKFYSSGKFNVKNKKRVGTWKLFNSSNELLKNIEMSNTLNFCKVTPVISDTNIKTFYYHAYFKSDTLVAHGEYFFNNAKQKSIGKYSNGYKTGVWLTYTENKLYLVEGYEKALNQKLFFSDNGFVTHINNTDTNGVLNGYKIVFDEKNNIKEVGKYCNNTKIGEWSYYINGLLYARGCHFPDFLYSEYKDGKFHVVNHLGELAFRLYSEKILNNLSTESIYYLKDGKWEYFNPDGIISKIEYYNKGELKKTKTYSRGKTKK